MTSPTFGLAVSLVYFSSVVYAQNMASAVLDSDGDPLRPNTRYYMLSAAAAGGGLALSVRDHRRPCPQNVMQEPNKNSVGLPLRLFPASQGAIAPSADVNLVFSAATTCVQQTVWKVGEADPFTGRRYVGSNGVVGRPGAETAGNWFKIENSGGGGSGNYYYKMVYCPSVCRGGCGSACGDLGTFVEGGRRWIGVGGEPLLVTFKKLA